MSGELVLAAETGGVLLGPDGRVLLSDPTAGPCCGPTPGEPCPYCESTPANRTLLLSAPFTLCGCVIHGLGSTYYVEIVGDFLGTHVLPQDPYNSCRWYAQLPGVRLRCRFYTYSMNCSGYYEEGYRDDAYASIELTAAEVIIRAWVRSTPPYLALFSYSGPRGNACVESGPHANQITCGGSLSWGIPVASGGSASQEAGS